jgi:uncharacterized membrane protein
MSQRDRLTVKDHGISATHYGSLGAIVLLGAILRGLNLGQKPLWLDEILTALFTLGRSATDIPRGQWWPSSDLDALLNFNAAATCAQITQAVAIDSNHPPLFFCAIHQWLRLLPLDSLSLAWALRSLPALLGVACILALYWLGRLVLTPRTGLVAALLMAVSPFAVYLSQEARHYTLPMLLIALSLAALVQLQQDLRDRRFRWGCWLGWVGLSLLGLYVHYFVILAITAQGLALMGELAWRDWHQGRPTWTGWGAIALAALGLLMGYAPWLPTCWEHLNRPEASWLTITDPSWGDRLGSLAQLVASWIVMGVALPVEHQPLPIVILSGSIMLLSLVYVLVRSWQPAVALSRAARTYPGIPLMVSFTAIMVLEFLVIVYGLNKDLTLAPRYSFVYYPGICVLLAALLSVPRPWAVPRRSLLWGLVSLGLLSSLLVTAGLVFQKPYIPDRVAQTLIGQGDRPVALLTVDQSLQDVALGLSFALATQTHPPQPSSPPSLQLAAVHRPGGYRAVWPEVATLNGSLPRPAHLWVLVSPGTPDRLLPDTLIPSATDAIACVKQPDQRHRIGHIYQRYDCPPAR